MLTEKQTDEVMDALSELRGPSNRQFAALRTVIEDTVKDANDLATEPTATPDERTYWGAADRQLRDLLSMLEDMRNGTFVAPNAQQRPKAKEPEE